MTPAHAATGALVLDRVRLHDAGSVMQSFARTSAAGTWITAQVMQDGRLGRSHAYHLRHGDLTLTHLSADGHQILSWMYLKGFGHGESISVQAAHPGLWIWTEAVSRQGPDEFPDGFGTQIARFRWAAGRTITPTSAGVRLFDPHPGTWRNAPSISGGFIAARYMLSNGTAAADVYTLGDFLNHRFTPVLHLPRPQPPGTGQGWALLPTADRIAWLTGDHYSAANPPPGDTKLTIYGTSGIISQEAILDGLGLSWREPEGVQATGGQLCYGFASGPADGRRASVYCQ
jgi:hypothetical protein